MKSVRIASPLTVIFVFLGVASCASDGLFVKDDSCADGETRCVSNVVERCHTGDWRRWSECSVTGQSCVSIEGVAQCYTLTATESETVVEAEDSSSEGKGDTGSFSETDLHVDTMTDNPTDDSSEGSSDPSDFADSDDATESENTTDDSDTLTDTAVDSEPEHTDDTQVDSADTMTDTPATDTADTTTDTATDTDDTETEGTIDTVDDTGTEMCSDSATEPPADTDSGPSVCGDGKRAEDEACDDGNDKLLDGCTPDCQLEPDCLSIGACSAICGDGITMGDEECDDGNLRNGDGCSAACTAEADYVCTTDCTDSDCVIALEVLYRDFPESHTDFEVDDSVCGSGVLQGAVKSVLGGDGKPVPVPAVAGTCMKHFKQWYEGAPDLVSKLKLFKEEYRINSFINRWGENGEKWKSEGIGLPREYDGTPVFFPVDELPSLETADAQIPPEYGGGDSWSMESDFVDNALKHNFYFTSEMIYWFKYDPDDEATLKIMGDDDFWVFINGHLVLDFGGIHTPQPIWNESNDGQVVLDENTGESLEMESGEVYAIRIFHAERKWGGSSLKLRLNQFQSVVSTCHIE